MHMDQRKHRRFQSKGEAFAAFINPDQSIVVGKIADISLNGVGVIYLATDDVVTGTPDVEVFGLDSIHLHRIRSTVVYDSYLPGESSDFIAVKRCGVKFDPLDYEMELELKGYMHKYCSGLGEC